MDIYGKLDLKGNLLHNTGFAVDEEFPVNPVIGRFVLKNKRIYACIDIHGGVPLYVSLTQELDLKTYKQEIPALEWTIVHELNTTDLIVQVFDLNNKVIVPNEIDCSNISIVRINFAIPFSGKAVLMTGESIGVAKNYIAYESSFINQSKWIINHNLGYNPIVQCIVDGALAFPEIQFVSSLQAIATFINPTSGSVRCL